MSENNLEEQDATWPWHALVSPVQSEFVSLFVVISELHKKLNKKWVRIGWAGSGSQGVTSYRRTPNFESGTFEGKVNLPSPYPLLCKRQRDCVSLGTENVGKVIFPLGFLLTQLPGTAEWHIDGTRFVREASEILLYVSCLLLKSWPKCLNEVSATVPLCSPRTLQGLHIQMYAPSTNLGNAFLELPQVTSL